MEVQAGLIIKQDPIWKIMRAKRVGGIGSSCRTPVLQVRSPEFKSQYWQEIKTFSF
jgi:hypothetical protein